MPARKRSSTSEEYSVANLSRAASTERSLLSQQMHFNSDNGVSQSSPHMGPGSLEDLEPLVGSSRQNVPYSAPREASNGGVAPLMNGALHGLTHESSHEGHTQQPAAMIHSRVKRGSSVEWNPHVLGNKSSQQHSQVSSETMMVYCPSLFLTRAGQPSAAIV